MTYKILVYMHVCTEFPVDIQKKKFIQIEKSCTRLFTIITDFKGSVLFLHVNKYSKI